MTAIVTAALVALVSAFVGLPWALVVRRRADDLVSFVGDAVLIGLVLTVIGLTIYSWIGAVGLGLAVVVELALVAFLLRRRQDLVWPTLPVRRELVWAVAFVVVLAVALVLRRHTIDYITYTGDMGAYVNWANQFLRTGGLHASWPPFYPMFLVLGGLLTGAKGVTAIVAITGLLLMIATVRVLRMAGVAPWIALIAAALIAVHPESIWFSQIPLSESLNAPLLMIWLMAFIGVFKSERNAQIGWAFVGGVSMLALSLLRGTAPILVAPLVIIAVIALIAPRWRYLAPRLWAVLLANGAGAAIGFWYGVERIPQYYVQTQIRVLLPGGLFRRLVEIGVLRVGVVSAIVAILTIVVLAVVFWLVRRFSGGAFTRATREGLSVGIGVRVVEVALGLLLLVAVVDSDLSGSDVWAILHRMAFLLVVAAILTPFVLAFVRHSRETASLAIVATTVAAVFVLLQNKRLETFRPHSTFLYWDRYLYSEFFPVMIVLVGLLLSVGYRLLSVRIVAKDVVFARAKSTTAFGVTGIVVALVAFEMIQAVLPTTTLIQQNTLLQGAGQIATDLQNDMSKVDQPFLWGGSSESSVTSSGFPNTWMAFATPLAISYGRTYANSQQGQPKGDFSPDPVLTASDIDVAMTCQKTSSVYVVESETTGPTLATRLARSDLTVTRVGRVDQNVTQLAQLREQDHWHVATYRLDVYEVVASGVPRESATCPAVPGP